MATPRSEAPLCITPLFIEPSDRQQYLDLDYPANQDSVLNDISQPHQELDWMVGNSHKYAGNRPISRGCNCIKALLHTIHSMPPLTNFNDTAKVINCDTVEIIRSCFSTCERLILCPHVHQSGCIMLLLAVLQQVDDILYRMTAVFKEDCKAAIRTQDYTSGGKNSSFLARSDLMRGVMILAAENSMDQTEYGIEKDSLRPMGVLQEYIAKLQNNYDARMLELF